MARFATAALLLAAAVEGKSLHFTWKDCGNSSTHGHVTSLTASPDPAPLGQPAKLAIKANVEKQLTSAAYETKIQILGVTLVDHKDALCGNSSFDISVLFVGKVGSVKVHGPPCPAPPGELDLSVEIMLEDAPGGVPSGGVATVAMTAKDQSGADVLCLEIDAHIIDKDGKDSPVTQAFANAINATAASKAMPTDVDITVPSTCAKPGDCGHAYQACCAGFVAKGFPCGCHLFDGDGKTGSDCGTCGSAYSACCAGFAAKGFPCTCDIKGGGVVVV